MFAMSQPQQPPPDPSARPLDPMAAWSASLDYEVDIRRYYKALEDLASVVKYLSWVDADAALGRNPRVLDGLASQTQAPLKSSLIGVYGALGTDRELFPRVLPHLYTHLMDHDSHVVRAATIEAVEIILRKRRDEVPQNVIDTVSAMLLDPYVWVRRKAVSAVEARRSDHRCVQAGDLRTPGGDRARSHERPALR